MTDFTVPAPLREDASFLVGAAGTGKTYLARQIVRAEPGVVLAATTGIAAVNLGEGTTINALLKYFDTASLIESYTIGRLTALLGKLYQSGVRRILLDEVSMLDAQQLTCLTRALDELAGRAYAVDQATVERVQAEQAAEAAETGATLEAPDGGRAWPIKLTLIGDFAQLPPVKAPFAFESPEWLRYEAHAHVLTQIWRQRDPAHHAALMAARRGDPGPVVDYFASRLVSTLDPTFPGPTLVAKNESVDRLNALRMDALPGTARVYRAERSGQQRPDWKIIPDALRLKEGALVMVLANRREGGEEDDPFAGHLLYANGDLGRVVALGEVTVTVQLQRGETVIVTPVTRLHTVPLEPGEGKALRAAGKAEEIQGKQRILGRVTYLPLRAAYATTVHKCVTGDTRVLVEGRGSVTVDTVRVGEWIDTGSGPARVVAVQQTLQYLGCLTTERGYAVTCSAEHRWKTPDRAEGFTAAAALRRGTRVQLTRATTIQGTQEIDRDLAWWIGATLGDGNWTDRREGQIHFASTTAVLRDRWMRIAQRLGGRPNTRRDQRGCHLTSLPLRLRCAAWGCDYVTAAHKRIPRVVWESGPAAWGACLQGLFDTDGHVKAHRIVYTTRSPRLAEDIQLLLLYLGVPSTKGTYMGRAGLYWHVRISAEGRDRFIAKVDASHPQKHTALRTWTPNRQLKPFDGTDRIKTWMCSQHAVPMFDVELETIHELGWGPIVGSNSQGLSLDAVQVNTHEHMFTQPGLLYVALSRCRTVEGLRIIGSVDGLARRCTVHPKIREWV